MLWIKAFHVVFMVTWFAGLFYLPRLFVYHAMSDDAASIERFKAMERKLFWGITTPGGVITVALGLWLLFAYLPATLAVTWMQLKLVLVALLIGYHLWCGKLVINFKHNRNRYSHVWYRWFNEVPVIFLVLIILLTIVKPF